MERRLLSLSGLAEYLSLTESQTQSLVDIGTLPQPIEILPGVFRWGRQSVDTTIERLEASPAPYPPSRRGTQPKPKRREKMELAALTPKQVAKLWQCSERHIYNLARRGEIKAIPVSRPLRISLKEIERIERTALEGLLRRGT